jgi:hypothetical protein
MRIVLESPTDDKVLYVHLQNNECTREVDIMYNNIAVARITYDGVIQSYDLSVKDTNHLKDLGVYMKPYEIIVSSSDGQY